MPLVAHGRRGHRLDVLRTECGLSAAVGNWPDDTQRRLPPGVERARLAPSLKGARGSHLISRPSTSSGDMRLCPPHHGSER